MHSLPKYSSSYLSYNPQYCMQFPRQSFIAVFFKSIKNFKLLPNFLSIWLLLVKAIINLFITTFSVVVCENFKVICRFLNHCISYPHQYVNFWQSPRIRLFPNLNVLVCCSETLLMMYLIYHLHIICINLECIN